MATAAVLFPPSNGAMPGSRPLPTAPFPDAQNRTSSDHDSVISPEPIALNWASAFKKLLGEIKPSSKKLFVKESYWRDLLCMTWDFHTLEGPEQITEYIQSASKDDRITDISLDTSVALKMPQFADFGSLKVVQAFLKLESASGRGNGLVRLVSDTNDGGKWKAFTLFTTLHELKGYEETIRSRRPTGVQRGVEDRGQNWKDRLASQQNFQDGREPTVLIIGKLCNASVLQNTVSLWISFVQVLAKVDSPSLLGLSNLA